VATWSFNAKSGQNENLLDGRLTDLAVADEQLLEMKVRRRWKNWVQKKMANMKDVAHER
jgi:hypothetical protein